MVSRSEAVPVGGMYGRGLGGKYLEKGNGMSDSEDPLFTLPQPLHKQRKRKEAVGVGGMKNWND